MPGTQSLTLKNWSSTRRSRVDGRQDNEILSDLSGKCLNSYLDGKSTL
jgi:hypothetical protein